MRYTRTDESKNLYRITMDNAQVTHRESDLDLKEFAEGIKPEWDKRGKRVAKVDLIEAASGSDPKPKAKAKAKPDARAAVERLSDTSSKENSD